MLSQVGELRLRRKFKMSSEYVICEKAFLNTYLNYPDNPPRYLRKDMQDSLSKEQIEKIDKLGERIEGIERTLRENKNLIKKSSHPAAHKRLKERFFELSDFVPAKKF